MDYQKYIEKLSLSIYHNTIKENKNHYKHYEEALAKMVEESKDYQVNETIMIIVGICWYNLAKLTHRPKYLKIALDYMRKKTENVLWTLQMIALTSARGSHQQAYSEAVKITELILQLIKKLQLPEKLILFARQISQIISRSPKAYSINESTIQQFQNIPKFKSTCPLITRKFHIADIMAMQAIDPEITAIYQENQPDQQKLFYYALYLSIACFTRATEKFYCRDTSQRNYHYKAIQIASYIYEGKSTYLRFLYRTYFDHYKESLQKIEEEQNHHQLAHRVQIDPIEVAMVKMPWEDPKEEVLQGQIQIKEQ